MRCAVGEGKVSGWVGGRGGRDVPSMVGPRCSVAGAATSKDCTVVKSLLRKSTLLRFKAARDRKGACWDWVGFGWVGGWVDI